MEYNVFCLEPEWIGKELRWLDTVATDKVYAVVAEKFTGLCHLLPIETIAVLASMPEKPITAEPEQKPIERSDGSITFSDEKDLHIITGSNLKERSYDLAKLTYDWFNTTNDAFYERYGFNFNPHEYPGLYEKVKKIVDAEAKINLENTFMRAT